MLLIGLDGQVGERHGGGDRAEETVQELDKPGRGEPDATYS